MTKMDELYTALGTGSLGVPTVKIFQEKFLSYATSKGVNLTADGIYFAEGHMNYWNGFDAWCNYIKNGLYADSPVACLNSSLTYDYGVHWMTITKYFTSDEDIRYIKVSTWGDIHSINFKTWYDAEILSFAKTGGLVYFQ